MNYINHYINKIICGDALEILKEIPGESVNCCACSPPYWGLRDYGIESVIWDGDKDCKHDFREYDSKLLHENRQNLDGGTLGNPQYRKNLHGFGKAKAGFCSKCGAWRGSLGLEPTFELYIKHLCDIFDEVKRVLRKDGTCFINIGDSYGGSGNASGHTKDTKNLGYKTLEMGATKGNQKITRQYAKCLLDIPYRFSIEMINRGWIKRNTIIWYKKNCMPSSANDRFTVDFEYLFFFTKNNKAIFWTNEKTLECVDKKPLGTKGIEAKDWEWRPCPACSNKNYFNYRTRDVMRKGEGCPQFKASNGEKKNIKNKICPRCKGLKKVKYSLWSGHDYWFEQQFDKYDYPLNRWGGDIQKSRTEKKTIYEKTMKLGKTSKLVEGAVRPNPQGRNKRSVWAIPTQPFPEAHFAVYPEGLIEIPIKAGCPEFVCKKCGKARVKIYKDTGEYEICGGNNSITAEQIQKVSPTSTLLTGKRRVRKEIGYTDCGCNAGFEGGIVLDLFMGAGTTALVAVKQRKMFIGIEIKQEYIDMANRRIAKVQQEIF